ncbi:MAG TPA: zf-HC2 domain-containing protein [Verrucomicrobiae bacterium]|jgi:anti-sigma factor RsiW|nr:zf-HC2 domain-containing protein [Verrucomicrobiae bacterium]
MSCTRMENKVLAYVDGRLKESERLEMEKHLSACGACQLRVNEFRAVAGFLDELPQIEPSAAFDVRVRARVAAEPVKQGWWAWFTPSPRVAFAASLLLLATVWIGSRPPDPRTLTAADEAQIDQDLPVLENFDVLSDFGALTDLPQPVQPDDVNDSNQDQNQNEGQPKNDGNSQTM